MNFDFTRRQFLATIGAGLASSALPSLGDGSVVRKGRLVTDRKINIACIGCGGKGESDVGAMSGENIVGLCDVDFNRGAPQFQAHPEAAIFRDWREMLLCLDEQIDAVVISTPDHMHFPPAMLAMELGKHVYVQKPMAHTVTEARILREQARLHNVVTQMGNQGHSNEGTRLLKEWVEAGAIGDVREVHIWTNRPIWNQDREVPTDIRPVPPTLDWNRWLGVAEWRPYCHGYLPVEWRGWWDFGTGALGDMGCHTMDAAFWALNLGAPTRVSAHVEGGSEQSCPKGSIVTYEFPARGKLPPVVVKWHDGSCRPPRPAQLEEGVEMPESGQLLFGSKGTIMDGTDYCENPHLIPRSANREFRAHRPPKTLPRIPHGHDQNWLDAIRGKIAAPCSNFEHAGPLTEMVLLGAAAVRARASFNWNAETLTCDNPAAQRYIDKTYRAF